MKWRPFQPLFDRADRWEIRISGWRWKETLIGFGGFAVLATVIGVVALLRHDEPEIYLLSFWLSSASVCCLLFLLIQRKAPLTSMFVFYIGSAAVIAFGLFIFFDLYSFEEDTIGLVICYLIFVIIYGYVWIHICLMMFQDVARMANTTITSIVTIITAGFNIFIMAIPRANQEQTVALSAFQLFVNLILFPMLFNGTVARFLIELRNYYEKLDKTS